jgi:hypothetical protein
MDTRQRDTSISMLLFLFSWVCFFITWYVCTNDSQCSSGDRKQVKIVLIVASVLIGLLEIGLFICLIKRCNRDHNHLEGVELQDL